jgi:hypothetical protein
MLAAIGFGDGQHASDKEPPVIRVRVLSQKTSGLGKRVREGEERGALGGQSKHTLDQANLGENVAPDCPFRLSFS